MKGADAEERARCFLQNKRCEDFYYLNQSGCTSIDGWNEEKLYADLKVSLGRCAHRPTRTGSPPAHGRARSLIAPGRPRLLRAP